MSFGTPQGRSSFGGKRSSTEQKKKDRRRKQEFHKHKIRLREEPQVDFESLKAKVILSLERLGQQVFPLEPGGYSFESWMKSLNLLLNDFEAKAGSSNLPPEYFQKRAEVAEALLKPPDEVSDIDSRIVEARNEEINISERIKGLNSQIHSARSQDIAEISSKVARLRKDRKEYSTELKDEKNRLMTQKQQQVESSSSSSSVSLLRRIFSFGKSSQNNNGNDDDSSETRIDDLEQKIQMLDEKISGLQKEERDSSSADIATYEDKLREQNEKLEQIRSDLQQLERTRLEKMQLSERRKEATRMLTEVISRVTSP